MASTPTLRCLVSGLAALALLIACASEPMRPSTVLLGDGSQTFLVLPLNVAAVMPSELELLSPVVWKELELYLRAQGKELKTISRTAARNLWVRSIQQVRGGEEGFRAGYDEAARAMALELGKHAEFDALIAPSLFVREAHITNRAARWDGVEHELELEARGLAARNLAATTPLEGVVPAASLHVAIFDSRGEKLHEAPGGLDLLVSVRVAVVNPDGEGASVEIAPQPSFEFVTRTGLFGDRERLRQGIAAAFDPFLPPILPPVAE